MHPSFAHLDHRPWPLPDSRWNWRQSWIDLAFIHYPAHAETVAAQLPPGLQLQTFDDRAWLGIVPFRMDDVGWRQTPALPIVGNFPELNLRTYVEVDGMPGVYFFSLDAASRSMVTAGRGLYNLPYHYAYIELNRRGKAWRYASMRTGGEVQFSATYEAVGDVFFAESGTFEHWATERYCLYADGKDGQLRRTQVHHAPWPLQHAKVVISENDLIEAAGLQTADGGPVCHASSGVAVVAYPSERLERRR